MLSKTAQVCWKILTLKFPILIIQLTIDISKDTMAGSSYISKKNKTVFFQKYDQI